MAEFRALRSVGILLAAWAGGRMLIADIDQLDLAAPKAPAQNVSASKETRPRQAVAILRIEPRLKLNVIKRLSRVYPAHGVDLTKPSGSDVAIFQAPSGQSFVRGDALEVTSKMLQPIREASTIQPHPAIPSPRHGQSWSLSSWTLWREGRSAVPLAPGQLAGSQAGLRIVAPSLLSSGRTSLAPALRLSSALSPVRQIEGALSVVATHRGSSGRVEAFIERRFSVARSARNAFGAGLAGGGELTLASSAITLRGYGQAGIVGIRSRDLYIDGALSAERRLYETTGLDIAVGAGTWGGAQPGVSRVDTGPFAAITTRALRLPIRTTIGWRARIAGNAAPGSGPVVTLGADF